ncbi:hypothetical protein K1719_030200 [Acacia pycnantha]|nr:hypothetical protein K1719_030200 [Acacia pycnantha]
MFTDGLKTFRMLVGAREQGGPKWFYPKCPRQPGNSECGYYVIHYMQSIVSSRRITADMDVVSWNSIISGLDQFYKPLNVSRR